MTESDNEIVLRRVLRLFRNGMVELIRSKLDEAFGADAESNLSSLYQKVDGRTGKTQWQTMRDNAEFARAAIEVSTKVSDCYEVLGVADFHNIVDKFYGQIAGLQLPLTELQLARKRSTLRCLQQIKTLRDPNAHEVSEAIDAESVTLGGLNCIKVLDALGLIEVASGIREFLKEFQDLEQLRIATVVSLSETDALAKIVVASLSDVGVRCHQTAISADKVGVSRTLDRGSRTNVVVVVPQALQSADLLSAEVQHFNDIIGRCLESGHQPTIVFHHSLSANTLDRLISEQLRGRLTRRPVIFIDAYARPAAETIKRGLLAFPVSLSGLENRQVRVEVPTARALSDKDFAIQLLLILKEQDLTQFRIVSPFLTDVKPSQFGYASLSSLLADARNRGCSIEVITRPPVAADPSASAKFTLLTVLRQLEIPIYLNANLHSKIYVSKRKPDRFTWILGSHNLTQRALSTSMETSLLGYRKAEFDEVTAEIERIRRHKSTEGYDVWFAKHRRNRAMSAN